MHKYLLSQKQINEILSRARYWDEVKQREHGVSEILWHELQETTNSIGLPILWVLKEYAEYANKAKSEAHPQAESEGYNG